MKFNFKSFFVILISIVLIIAAIYYVKKYSFDPEKNSNPNVEIYNDIALSDTQKKGYNTYLNGSIFYPSFYTAFKLPDKVISFIDCKKNQEFIVSYALAWANENDKNNLEANILKNQNSNINEIKTEYLQSLVTKIFDTNLELNKTNVDNYTMPIFNYNIAKYPLKANKLTFNKDTNQYLLYFDMLKSDSTKSNTEDVNYNKSDVINSYLLKFKQQDIQKNVNEIVTDMVLVSIQKVK